MAPNKTITKRTVEIFFEISMNFLAKFSAVCLIVNPISTGTVTIANTLKAIRIKENSFFTVSLKKCEYEYPTTTGIVNTHKRLIVAVSEIDIATSPRPKDVSKFVVTPPK